MQAIHTLKRIDGSAAALSDQVVIGVLPQVSNTAGVGAGNSVSTVVTFSKELPANYGVFITTNQNADAYVTSRTATGFTVVLSPNIASVQLSAGAFDVLIVG